MSETEGPIREDVVEAFREWCEETGEMQERGYPGGELEGQVVCDVGNDRLTMESDGTLGIVDEDVLASVEVDDVLLRGDHPGREILFMLDNDGWIEYDPR